jgi:hypothetical protein
MRNAAALLVANIGEACAVMPDVPHAPSRDL